MNDGLTEQEHFRRVLAFHNKDAEEYSKVRYGFNSITQVGYIIRRSIACEMLSGIKGNLLDVGCGPGTFIEAMKSSERTIYAIDLSPKMVEKAKRNSSEETDRFKFAVSNICDLGIRSSIFDGVICIGVLGYIPDLSKPLIELRRVMKPGAIGVLQISNSMSIKEKLYERWIPKLKVKLGIKRKSGFDFEFPLYSYGKYEFDRTVTNSGFEILDWCYYDFHIPFLERISMRATIHFAQILQRFSRNYYMSLLGGGYLVKIRRPQ